MIMTIIFIILIFGLGFCFGGLYGLKIADKINEEWYLLASKTNKDWAEYCETLIKEIKTLKRSDNE